MSVLRKAGRCLEGIMLLCVLASAYGCGRGIQEQPVSVPSRALMTMGTRASVTLPGSAADRLDEAADIVEEVFRDIERSLSIYREDSELSAINQNAGIAPVAVSAVTLDALVLAYEYARLSGGAFDPTVAPLVTIWRDAGTLRASLPDDGMLAEALALVDYRKLTLDVTGGHAYLQKRGMLLDLGGIAKGLAADIAAETLKNAGFDSFLVDLGGDIRCAGSPDRYPAWRVGIRHPMQPDGILGVLNMRRLTAVATSGNYERFVEINGRRFGHLIDPRSGRPSQGMAGVTVASATAATADAVSTALFVAGIDQADAILKQTNGAEALLIPDRMPLEIWVTPGFAAAFEPRAGYDSAVRLLAP